MFAAWGRFVHRHRLIVLLLSLLSVAVSAGLVARGGDLKNAGSFDQTEAGRAFALTGKELPGVGISFPVVFSSTALDVHSSAFQSAMERDLSRLGQDPRVRSIRTPFNDTVGGSVLLGTDGHHAVADVSLKTDDFATARHAFRDLRAKIGTDGLTVEAAGELAFVNEVDQISTSDVQLSEGVSSIAALILLLLVFGTVIAAVLPLGAGLLSVLAATGTMLALAHFMDVSQYALNVLTLVGLGVAIDYSLFITSRFREQLDAGDDVPTALATSLATAGKAITFSAFTVALGLSSMLFYQGTSMVSLGIAGAVVVGFSVLFGLTFLPATLALLGTRVNALTLPWGHVRHTGRGMWHRWATWVMRHPIAVMVPVVALLLVAGSPFPQLHEQNSDVHQLPASAETRRGSDALSQYFPQYAQDQVVLVDHFSDGKPANDPAHVAAVYAQARQLASHSGILSVKGPVTFNPQFTVADYQHALADPKSLPPAAQAVITSSVGKDLILLTANSSYSDSSDAAHALIRDLRAHVASIPGGEVLISGNTAYDIDIVQYLLDRTPLAVLYVMVTTYIVLFLLLRSVVLPLKAVVMNLLSLSASFGALVWIFQEGHLQQQLGFTPSPIDPIIPILLFSIVFGLSMDYEVFLLSRIREEYIRTGDNQHAVAEGLERSGRLITGAAAIMVAVFLAFALAHLIIIKTIGISMALAVAIDATLVRALIVPALMRLLGRVNWWAPGRLGNANRPRVQISEEPKATA